jgi:hypothetical protein
MPLAHEGGGTVNTLQQIATTITPRPGTLQALRVETVRQARRQGVPGDVIAMELAGLDSWWRAAPGQSFTWAIVADGHLVVKFEGDLASATAAAEESESVIHFGEFVARKRDKPTDSITQAARQRDYRRRVKARAKP